MVDAIEPADAVLTDGSAEALPGAPIVGLSGAEGDFAGLLPVGATSVQLDAALRAVAAGLAVRPLAILPERRFAPLPEDGSPTPTAREIEVSDRTRRRTEQQGNRAAARHLAAHRQIPPRAAVSQARRRLPRRSGRQGLEASDRRALTAPPIAKRWRAMAECDRWLRSPTLTQPCGPGPPPAMRERGPSAARRVRAFRVQR